MLICWVTVQRYMYSGTISNILQEKGKVGLHLTCKAFAVVTILYNRRHFGFNFKP